MKNEAVVSRSNFSPQQMKVFTWWSGKNTRKKDGIICDGAVRSGKTYCMSMSFVMWACANFHNRAFAFCGRTIASVRRNLVTPMISNAEAWGFKITDRTSKNYLEISTSFGSNRFYIFGGKDESSASLIQGMTLCGVLMDETALMPRSFVEQAVARCSVEGSKLWFNCNPENQFHWFKKEWIDKAEEKNLLYLHFKMSDNPTLTKQVLKRYKTLYSGTFYQRFVLGSWVNTQGLVYANFDPRLNVAESLPNEFEKYAVSCDYGTVNPSSFGLWGLSAGVWYRISEYYYDSRREDSQRTDEEHYSALERLCGDRKPEMVICDPSAASFIECIRRHGKFTVVKAQNDVLSGIRRVSSALATGKIKISADCHDSIREFSQYCWDRSAGVDAPLKENDHAMDDIRYFVTRYMKNDESPFFVMSLER